MQVSVTAWPLMFTLISKFCSECLRHVLDVQLKAHL